MNEYQQRDGVLSEMGFPSYREYLRSPLWKSIWRKVLNRDGNRCHVCGKWAIQVHHLSYERNVLLGDDLSQLRSICRGCHKRIEFTPEGNKNDLPLANCKAKWLSGERQVPGTKRIRGKPKSKKTLRRRLLKRIASANRDRRFQERSRKSVASGKQPQKAISSSDDPKKGNLEALPGARPQVSGMESKRETYPMKARRPERQRPAQAR
jgi:hypothetical protein